MVISLTRAVLVLASLGTYAKADQTNWVVTPFDMPESAIYDREQGRIVVSLIGGQPGEADGNGALALLSTDGELLDPAWITGLDAPKGMAIVGTTLLVADLTRLHEIDLTSGAIMRSLEVDGAVFLNDVTSDGEQAFVSDFMANRILRYKGGQVFSWLEDNLLHHPNGLLLDGDRLLVGSWGQGLRDDFSTDQPGSLLSVDLVDQSISVMSADIGNIDGVVRVGTHLLVNDWMTGHLYEVGSDGEANLVAEYAPGLADISAFGSTLLLPSMLEGSVAARPFP